MNKSLNTFRAFAFFGIFLFHTVGFGFGYIGVNAFFVLSGYLITPILLKTKDNTSSFKQYLKNFYGRRMLRIFPAYYFYLLAVTGIVLIAGWQHHDIFNVFFSQLSWLLTYAFNFFTASRFFVNNYLDAHFWSLAVEEQFYIFFPLLIFFVPYRKLKNTFILIILLGPLIRFLTGYIVDHHLLSVINPWKELTVYVLPFSNIDAFVIGGFFSVYLRRYTPGTGMIVGSFIGIISVGILTSYLFTNHYTLSSISSLGYGSLMHDSYKYIWAYTLFSFFFAMLLLRLNKRDLWPSIFENNILNYLGKISYGLYIYHLAIFQMVILHAKLLHIDSTSVTLQRTYTAIITLIITIIISILSFELFESRVIALKDKLFPKHAVVENKAG